MDFFQRRPFLEPLEDRHAPAVFRVVGTPGDDVIAPTQVSLPPGTTSLVVDALGGDDRVDLTGLTIPSLVHGGPGNDTLLGGAGWDRLFGGGGKDFLDGGPGLDFLDAGSSQERVTNGFSAYAWAQGTAGGLSPYDVRQAGAGTCVFLASLQQAASHGSLGGHVRYQGNGAYRVLLYHPDAHAWFWALSYFDGRFASYAGTQTDPHTPGNGEGEFWPLLYQRAYFYNFFRIGWLDGRSAAHFQGDYSGYTSTMLTGRPNWVSVWFGTNPQAIGSLVARGYQVVANIDAPAAKPYLVGDHAYGVEWVGVVNSNWYALLRNPWGVDGLAPSGNPSDGLVLAPWSHVARDFNFFSWV